MKNRRGFGTTRIPKWEVNAMLKYQAPIGGMVRPPEFYDEDKCSPKKESIEERKHPEEDLQIACADYLRSQPRILFWSIPNHLYLGKPTPQKINYMKKQKRMGLLKGASDLMMFFLNREGSPTFCVAELKAGYNKADEAQQAFMDGVNDRGGYSAVVKSIEDLKSLLEKAGY